MFLILHMLCFKHLRPKRRETGFEYRYLELSAARQLPKSQRNILGITGKKSTPEEKGLCLKQDMEGENQTQT